VTQIGLVRSRNAISCSADLVEFLGSQCELTTQLVCVLEDHKHLFQYDSDDRLCS